MTYSVHRMHPPVKRREPEKHMALGARFSKVEGEGGDYSEGAEF